MKAISQLLKAFANSPSKNKSTVEDFLEEFGSGSFALVILILSLPQAGPWPMPPGMSAIMGLPMMFIALQLMWGNSAIWLPQKLKQKSFSQKKLKTIIGKIVPTLKWLERILHPRMEFVFRPWGMRFIGLVIAVMALVVSLPIPGGNFLPALAICFLSLAVLERDGLLAILSLVACAVVLFVMYQLVGTALDAVAGWLENQA